MQILSNLTRPNDPTPLGNGTFDFDAAGLLAARHIAVAADTLSTLAAPLYAGFRSLETALVHETVAAGGTKIDFSRRTGKPGDKPVKLVRIAFVADFAAGEATTTVHTTGRIGDGARIGDLLVSGLQAYADVVHRGHDEAERIHSFKDNVRHAVLTGGYDLPLSDLTLLLDAYGYVDGLDEVVPAKAGTASFARPTYKLQWALHEHLHQLMRGADLHHSAA